MKNLLKPFINKLARIYGAFAVLPFFVVGYKEREPNRISHRNWPDFLQSMFDKPGMRILEIGSRNVTGANHRSRFKNAEYVGFDFYAGENVDVVGDAHKLTSYFDSSEKFDLIFSSAVFEHLHMPWVAAVQCQKMLKDGGYVFIETHFSFSSHERPWHFFQFSDMGLRALFNEALGFDVVESGLSNPIYGYFAHDADPYLRYLPVTELYCHSEIFAKKTRSIDNFSWNDVSMDDVVQGTRYPEPKKNS